MTKRAQTDVLAPRQEHATIVVVGLPRSGRSMVAGVLREFGVQMGSSAETRTVAAVLGEGGRVAELRTVIQRNDARHDVWGLELPASCRLLPSFLHLFRNPRVIVILRDPVAIAADGGIAAAVKSRRLVAKAAAENLALSDLVRVMDEPTLAISHEFAIASPAEFVSALAAHCGLDVPEGRRLRGVRVIKSGSLPSPCPALLWYEGRLMSVDEGVARGWARQMPTNEPCMVEIVSGGTVIGRGLSNKASSSRALGAEGRGFEIALRAQLSGRDLIARVAGTATVLSASLPARRPRRGARQ